jgi:ABC-type phosphate transport system substrate-binding protein
MSAFKQKLARLGATAGVLAASTAAIMAVGGVTASSALAKPVCETISGVSTLQGEGSTLQNVAQTEIWTPAYNAECVSPKVHFAYTGTGSGAALTSFGYNGGAIKTTEAYVGSDEAPTSTQITTAKGKAGGANPVIIPVAQTSIAVVANVPSGCEIVKGITWKDLNKVFAGTIKQWSELETDNGNAACNANITRVVREDGSGTSFQFKNYLSTLETTKSAVGPGEVEVNATAPKCATKNWAEIRNNGGTPNVNLAWPESKHLVGGVTVGCAAEGTLSPVTKQSGGGNLVTFVKETPNTIGYAAYSDVLAKGATSKAVSLQNSETEGKHYGAPGAGTESKEANCGGRLYTVPSSTTGLEVDWSGVFGAKPNIGFEKGNTFYPLCTLTYDLSWHGTTSGYTTAGYTNGAATAAAVKGYLLNYVLEEEEGQKALKSKGYQALPHEAGSQVLAAAKLAAGNIN